MRRPDVARHFAVSLLTALALLGATRTHAHAAAPSATATTLDKLCADYWQGELRASPTRATQLGDRRYDALLSDRSPAGEEKYLSSIRAFRARAEAIDAGALDA